MIGRLTLAMAIAAGTISLFAQGPDALKVWVSIREQLLRDPTYFESVKGSGLPLFEGTVVTVDPAQRPSTLMIGIETPLVAELRLRITRNGEPARMHITPPRKARIRFRTAVVESYTPRPFVLTATIDEMDIDFVDGEGAR